MSKWPQGSSHAEIQREGSVAPGASFEAGVVSLHSLEAVMADTAAQISQELLGFRV